MADDGPDHPPTQEHRNLSGSKNLNEISEFGSIRNSLELLGKHDVKTVNPSALGDLVVRPKVRPNYLER